MVRKSTPFVEAETLFFDGLIRINEHEGPMGDLVKTPRHLAQRMSYHQGDPGQILTHLVLPMGHRL